MADICGLEPHAARRKGSSPLLPTRESASLLIKARDTVNQVKPDFKMTQISHSHHFNGHQFSRLERHSDKVEVPGSIPGCPTSDMESEPIAHRPIQQIKLFDEIVLPPGSLYRSKCTIGVVVTSVPSKHLWRVRVPYGAPFSQGYTKLFRLIDSQFRVKHAMSHPLRTQKP